MDIIEENKETDEEVFFALPEEKSLSEEIMKILENNGLKESPSDFFKKDSQEKEPYAIIIRDAALSLVKKIVPEKTLLDFLHKHLKISLKIGEKVLEEIKEKLIPYIKILTPQEIEAKTQKENLENELLKKIGNPPQNPVKREVSVKSVPQEEHTKFNQNTFASEKKGPDTYREPIK
jgi:hypothetical protein